MKKLLATLLSILMIISVLPAGVMGITASAATNPYPVNNYNSTGEWSNCTWSVWQLVYDNLGIALPGGWGNAGSSWITNAQNAGYSTGSNPQKNSIIVFDGHVAFVTDISADGSQVYIKEGGYGYAPNQTYHEGWCNAYGSRNGGQAILGYIYLVKMESSEFEISNNMLVKYNGTSKNVVIPSNVTEIGNYAFHENKYVETVTLSNNVTKIGDGAFWNCVNLNNINLYANLEEIGSWAFDGCTSLTRISFSDKLKKIGPRAFVNCSGIKSIHIPNSVTELGDTAFSQCTSLTNIYIGTGISEIKDYTFFNCNKVDDVILAGNIKSIGMRAFVKCRNLTSITLPSTLTSIADNAFLDCDNLKYVFYSGTKQQWANINIGSNNTDLIYAKIHYNGAPHKLSWVTVKKATVNASGQKQEKCAECGEVTQTAKISQLTPDTPKVKSVETTSSGVKVTWGKVSGADKYLVYRKTYNSKTKKWSGWSALTKKATSSSYTDKTAKSGTYYTYTVEAQNEAGYSGYTSGLKTYFLSTPKLSSATSSKSGITVKWGKVKGASGYYVYRKTSSGSWKKIATVKGNTKVSYKDKSAKKGKTYKYTVKAYYSSYTSYYNKSGLKIKDKY